MHLFHNVPLFRMSQGSSPNCLSIRVKAFGTFRNFVFSAASAFEVKHDICDWRQQACPFPAGVVSLVSGEVKHIVHLIRWNLKAVYALVADLNTGLDWHNARTLGLGTESCCFTNCFGFPVCHQLVPHLVPNFPACLSVMCRGVYVCALFWLGPFRRVGWFRRSVCSPPPPALFLAVCPSCVRFFLPLAFLGWPGSGRVCVCVTSK